MGSIDEKNLISNQPLKDFQKLKTLFNHMIKKGFAEKEVSEPLS